MGTFMGNICYPLTYSALFSGISKSAGEHHHKVLLRSSKPDWSAKVLCMRKRFNPAVYRIITDGKANLIQCTDNIPNTIKLSTSQEPGISPMLFEELLCFIIG